MSVELKTPHSRPLTYINADDLGEPLTPSHLILGYRVLSLPDPSATPAHDPDYNQTPEVLNRRMRYVKSICHHFWGRWKTEYLQELREFHRKRRQQKDNGATGIPIWEGQIVTVYEKGAPRLLWKLGRIERLISSADEKVRSAVIRVASKSGHSSTLRCPIQHLFPLEVEHSERATLPVNDITSTNSQASGVSQRDENTRPRRAAAMDARNQIAACFLDD